jgi:hypothetical protein
MPKWLILLIKENDQQVTYKALGKDMYKKYVAAFTHWPYVDSGSHVRVSQSLLLFRENEFHESFAPRGFSFSLPTVNQVNDRFHEKTSRAGRSLWSKHNISSSDGFPIQIPSHNARHWLSTKAERGGMDELTLANWAGRAKVSDNEHYDHRTEKEKSEEARGLVLAEDASILDKMEANIPVTYEDLGKNQLGIGLVTEQGVCEHDFSMMPCQRHGDCETCKEMVCIKGFSSSLELLKDREKQIAEQLNNATKNHEMGTFGADRWISSTGWRLSHIRTKIRLLEDESVADGTPIRIPDEFDPSPAKIILMEKGMEHEVKQPDSILLDDDVLDLLGMQ